MEPAELKLMSKGPLFELYRVGRNRLLKVVSESAKTSGSSKLLDSEWQITSEGDHPGFRKSLDREQLEGREGIVLEYVSGKSCQEYFKAKVAEVGEFLELAVNLADSLQYLHQSGYIHTRINPGHIILKSRSKKPVIIGLTGSVRGSKVDEYPVFLESFSENELPYISPEQTGRTEQSISKASDMYSLGAVFFNVLTGEPPFESGDSLQLIHAHIAKNAPLAHSRRKEVPEAISVIIDKLLQKIPFERYQSAADLHDDLKKCLEEWRQTGKIEGKTIPGKGQDRQFKLSDKLVGRGRDFGHLTEAFERVKEGGREVVLISGRSGVGKTVFTRALKPDVLKSSGFFLEGKFDEFQRGIPFAGLTQCFRQFFIRLFSQGDQESIDYWKERFEKGIGNASGILVNIIPELETLLGEETGQATLESSEAGNQLRYAMRSMIQVVSSKEHPLVLFIDDVQWSDIDTLNLVQSMLSDTGIEYLLIIGTYREESLQKGDPILQKLIDIGRSFEGSSIIRLKHLKSRDIKNLIDKSFHEGVVNQDSLVDLVMEITEGNAFYVNQLLTNLVREKLLEIDPEIKQWKWEEEEVRISNPSGDLEQFIEKRLNRLENHAKKLLVLASCIGNTADTELLTFLYGQTISLPLQDIIQEGLILQDEKDLVFGHDRVREMAYDMIGEPKRSETHLSIADYLSEKLEEDDERIFEVVSNLNLGRSVITSEEKMIKAAEFNLRAGEKAMASAAFGPAFEYMKSGLDYLDRAGPEDNYHLRLKLSGYAAELAALNGDYQQMDLISENADQWVQSTIDRKQFVLATIKSLMARKMPREALKVEIDYLGELGYRLPYKGNKWQSLVGVLSMSLLMRGKNSENLEKLPINSEESEIAALQVINQAMTTSYFVEPDLLPRILSKNLSISLKSGNAPESANGYMGYGFILSGYLGGFNRGYDFGKLALKVLEKMDREDLLYIQTFQTHIFLMHWKEPISGIMAKLDRCYTQLLRIGSFETAAYSIHSYLYFAFFQGVDLKFLNQRSSEIVSVVNTLNQPTTLQRINMYYQAIINLSDEVANPWILKGEVYDEEEMIPVHHSENFPIATHNIHLLKSYMALLFYQYELAESELVAASEFNEAAAASFFVPLYDYLYVMVQCNLEGKAKKVKSTLKRLKTYAENAPFNYGVYYELAKAELAKSTGKISDARVIFDDAIYMARKAGNLHEEALGWERAGIFYLGIDREDKASSCFQYSYDLYLRWGAKSKANHLLEKHGNTIRMARTISLGGNTSEIRSAETIDLLSTVKSLQVLSTELDLNRLLEKMMEILIENAGAERGLLIIERDGEWEIKAERDINSEVVLIDGRKLDDKPDEEGSYIVPREIIHYVIRTKKSTVINDVKRDIQFSDIPYMAHREPRSILCMPLLNHDKLIGIVYLENTLTAGAFTRKIQESLNLLSAQLAISLENAIVYEELEDQVDQNQDLVTKLQIKVEEQEKTLKVFGQFVPQPVVEKTLASTTELSVFEGEQREVAVMFCDIRDFTPLSEELKPSDVVEMLNDFYSLMTEVIQKHNGTVTLFIGDEVMAAFGVPVAHRRNEQNAVMCALEMRNRLPELNKTYREKFNREIRIGIGINSGPVVAGILGSSAKLAYSITGDTVNTAKRIESLTKDLNNGIVISESIYDKCKELVEVEAWEPIQVKGKKEKLSVFTVLGRK